MSWLTFVGRLLCCAMAPLLLLAVLVSQPAMAVSPTRCKQYAATAIDQVKRGFQGNCPMSGWRWADNYDHHYQWCLNQPEPGNGLKSEQQAREDALRKCKAPAVGTPIFSPKTAPGAPPPAASTGCPSYMVGTPPNCHCPSDMSGDKCQYFNVH
jgi:hypothetical protein